MNKIKKYKYIDALRGVAILLVIMVHCSNRFDLPPLINQLMQIGPKGVQLFFIISAFFSFVNDIIFLLSFSDLLRSWDIM